MGKKPLELEGQKFGKLTVVARNGSDKYGHSMWDCKCDCGKDCIVVSTSLKKGLTTSCGCVHKEMISNLNKKHGMSGTRIYTIWKGMNERCSDVNNKNYGGKASPVKICNEWQGEHGAENFIKWSLENGYDENLEIDRIDSEKDYEPSNCRWVDTITQASNTKRNHYITYNNETHTMMEWSRIINIPCQTLANRINLLHWDIEKALTTPVKQIKKREA